jgi:putative ABC transport system permease protein
VINQTLARRMWPGRDPIGDHIQFPNVVPPRWFAIVGISGDFRDRGLGKEIRSTIYMSLLQNRLPGMRLLVRTKTPPYAMGAAVRAAIRARNADLSIDDAVTLDDMLSSSLSPERFSATLLTIFAALALVLASIGIYGVTSYGVAQRSHEIGVRLAIGASGWNVLAMILKQGIALAITGIVVGVCGALALTRLIAAMLFGVTAHDPLTIFAVGAILTTVTLLACLIPATRAMRLDPMAILRHD